MKIGIMGAGNIGATLGRAWAKAGHEIVFGVRSTRAPKVLDLLDSIEGKAKAQRVSNAIAFADVVVLAIPGKAVAEFVRTYATELSGKIIVDATNTMGQPEMHNMTLLEGSLPQSPAFRAFNTLGWEVLANPVVGGEQADLFFCGQSGAPREQLEALIEDVGLRPVYIGGAEMARLLDQMTRLWLTLTMVGGYSRHTAFRLLTD